MESIYLINDHLLLVILHLNAIVKKKSFKDTCRNVIETLKHLQLSLWLLQWKPVWREVIINRGG